MTFKNKGKLRNFLDFTLSGVISLVVSISLPFLFSRLLLLAVARNGTGGGLMWLPTYPDEILWTLCELLFSFPFLVSLVFLGFPTVLLLNNLGFQIGVDFTFPLWTRIPTMVGNTIIPFTIAAIFQILFWGAVTYLIRVGLVRFRRNRTAK